MEDGCTFLWEISHCASASEVQTHEVSYLKNLFFYNFVEKQRMGVLFGGTFLTVRQRLKFRGTRCLI